MRQAKQFHIEAPFSLSCRFAPGSVVGGGGRNQHRDGRDSAQANISNCLIEKQNDIPVTAYFSSERLLLSLFN